MKLKYISLLFLILLFLLSGKKKTNNIDVNIFTPRGNYNARLEIKDKVIHGAGQSPEAFYNYHNLMENSTKPLIYMTYFNLNGSLDVFFINLENEMIKYKEKFNVFLIPQIGLQMTTDGKPENHFENKVADGDYDEILKHFCDKLKKLSHPVFIRIGFEFNGSWNGYNPDSYKKSYKKITDFLRKYDIEASTVWCTAHPLDNYMEYYPGDEFVDWWSIDLFSSNELKMKSSIDFIKNAEKHNKPVMIGESTPRYIGVLKGKKSWEKWFEDYFELIRKHKNIKAFCYINWDWAKYPQWSNWGDARLEKNDYVKKEYIKNMKTSLYSHGQSEKSVKKLLGINDNTPPLKINNLNAELNSYSVNLKWDESKDDNKIIRYQIYKNDKLISYCYKTFFKLKNIKAGENGKYHIIAVDIGGNESEISNILNIKIPDRISKIQNGDFENKKSGWQTAEYHDGNITFEIDNKIKDKSAKLSIKKGTGTSWHAQFEQFFYSYEEMKYELSFDIISNKKAEIDIFLQQTHEPYESIFYKKIEVDNKIKSFNFSNIIQTKDDSLKLSFMVGHLNNTIVWIDNIKLLEINE